MSLQHRGGLIKAHEHFVFFKKQFEFIAEEAKWTEADKLWNLQRALNGAALMSYISFGPQETLASAMKRLQLQFVGEDPYAQYYNELRAYRQGKQQSTAQYKLIFDSKVHLCDISGSESDKITEKDKLFAFIRGLRPELQKEVLSEDCANIEEAFKRAKRAEFNIEQFEYNDKLMYQPTKRPFKEFGKNKKFKSIQKFPKIPSTNMRLQKRHIIHLVLFVRLLTV
eukprot:NODE_265_length_11346_cov_0.635814.p6 type:complete len:225 gc:universal NODE_265_length_11346_cov_0.635814:6800-6126(-)